MIAGRVSRYLDATAPLVVRGPDRSAATIGCVIDTGFDGALCLPPEQVAALQLTPIGSQLVVLGDGSEAELALYEAAVEWHGRLVLVPALEAEGGALLGMALLHGSRMTMDIVENGPLQIEPLR
jgi:clan AA aspartic protease